MRLSVIRGSQRRAIDVVLAAPEDQPGAAAAPSPPSADSQSDPGHAGGSAAPVNSISPLTVSGYVRLTDPLERAFTVEAPSGWRSEAGLARRSALQINPYVRSLAPDKMTYIMIGEPTLPSFTPPTQMNNAIGYGEGKLYDSGLGGLTLVWHYLPGAEFARFYGQTVLQGLCPGFKITATQNRPDLASQAKSLWPSMIPARADGGEVRFTCIHNKQDMEGRVGAATVASDVGWGVMLLGAFITPKGQSAKAEEILYHMAGSIQFSQAWNQKQNTLSQQAAIAINQRMQEIFRQQQAFMQKLNSVDQSFQSMDELISGFSTYHDSATGNNYSLSNANPYKWSDPSTGRIISTPTNVKPPWAPAYQSMPRKSQ